MFTIKKFEFDDLNVYYRETIGHGLTRYITLLSIAILSSCSHIISNFFLFIFQKMEDGLYSFADLQDIRSMPPSYFRCLFETLGTFCDEEPWTVLSQRTKRSSKLSNNGHLDCQAKRSSRLSGKMVI